MGTGSRPRPSKMQPHADAASTLLGTVLSIKTQYRHLVFPPKSGGEMSQPATGHDAPSPRHPGHCDGSVTGQYVNSLPGCRPCQPASRHGPYCRCCFLLLAPAGRDAAQSVNILCSWGSQQPASSPDPHSSFSRFGVSNSCHLGGSDGKNWALESVHTYIVHPHIRVHIQYRPGLYHRVPYHIGPYSRLCT